MFFRRDYDTPGPGVSPEEPEKTGPARFFEIVQLECVSLLKLNLLFLLSCLPVVTIPPAIFAMHTVVRRMVLDEPVDCFYHYRTAFKKHWRVSYGAFLTAALPFLCASTGAYFYLSRAASNPLLLAPFTLCATVFLLTALASTYFYALLSTDRPLRESLRLALMLAIARPLRAALAAVSVYGTLLLALLYFPLSAIYILFIGFSLPCLLANFFLRTVLKQYF